MNVFAVAQFCGGMIFPVKRNGTYYLHALVVAVLCMMVLCAEA